MLRRRPEYEYAKGLVEAYFVILTRGCGNDRCSNAHCKSNPDAVRLTTNEAAAKALVLAVEAPMAICLTPLQIDVGPETNDDETPATELCEACPSTPRKRLTTAVQLDTSINSPKRASQATKGKLLSPPRRSVNHAAEEAKH
ncbi:hypothetical protein SPRG_08587 [Saprolegnia parasitica CBS 223.65]|uniref:Ubiquitin-protein ligase E3A N-terminal zinc-binding domain-containing protein n=1 Tax=Saprolegnia parasitica (strain CBS 223.65) TaxID=695850 RepID=A0A067CGI4_SAPPC|nr:hypothetical protein SPRG_08587 [Saprolegnia parasitica CBS 223.65]KDO25932.1 hypothetical protein SPRG_08587 [Saprolegnia parasitica CBS 223.65]|eukprot:XP_012203221.1 hypothetical protein SPRG_08587 [Saprolegnia parasitica CBS 223.65]